MRGLWHTPVQVCLRNCVGCLVHASGVLGAVAVRLVPACDLGWCSQQVVSGHLVQPISIAADRVFLARRQLTSN